MLTRKLNKLKNTDLKSTSSLENLKQEKPENRNIQIIDQSLISQIDKKENIDNISPRVAVDKSANLQRITNTKDYDQPIASNLIPTNVTKFHIKE